MNYIAKWYDNILRRSSVSLSRAVRVEGLREEHLGPRFDFAKIDVLVEPAASFDVRFGPDVDQSDTTRMFLEAAVFGLLDILLVSGRHPLRNVCITLTRCEIDPIDSCQMAFYHAGRDAGKKIVSEIEELKLGRI